MLYHVLYHSILCCDDTDAVLRLGVQDKFLPLCGTIKLTFTDVQFAVIKIILKLCKTAGQLRRYCSNSSIHLANLRKKVFSFKVFGFHNQSAFLVVDESRKQRLQAALGRYGRRR